MAKGWSGYFRSIRRRSPRSPWFAAATCGAPSCIICVAAAASRRASLKRRARYWPMANQRRKPLPPNKLPHLQRDRQQIRDVERVADRDLFAESRRTAIEGDHVEILTDAEQFRLSLQIGLVNRVSGRDVVFVPARRQHLDVRHDVTRIMQVVDVGG